MKIKVSEPSLIVGRKFSEPAKAIQEWILVVLTVTVTVEADECAQRIILVGVSLQRPKESLFRPFKFISLDQSFAEARPAIGVIRREGHRLYKVGNCTLRIAA